MPFIIKTDIKGAIKQLRHIFKDQVPFVNSVAINQTAKLVQTAEREHMAQVFILRRKKWAELNVKIKPWANKKRQSATIAIDPPGGIDKDVFSQFEEKSFKRPESGTNVAIPTQTVRPNITNVVRSSKKPRNLKKAFKMRSSMGGKSFIAKRVRGVLQFLWQLKPQVPIDDRLEFEKTGKKVIFEEYEKEFAKAWRKFT